MLDKINGRNVNIAFIQFGCGGIGSWLAQFMGKFLHSICERYSVQQNLTMKYVIIDPDIVENRNILRQNFLPFNVGDYKCNAISKIIVTPLIQDKLIFIMERIDTPAKITRLLESFIAGDEETENIWIILGCVDNIKTRRAIYSAMKKVIKRDTKHDTFIYIDGGNEIDYGQVVTTVLTNSYWFPSVIRNWNNVSKKFPNIHKLFKENNENARDNVSCVFFGDQTMGINLKIAIEIFAIVQRLLINSIIPEPLVRTIVL